MHQHGLLSGRGLSIGKDRGTACAETMNHSIDRFVAWFCSFHIGDTLIVQGREKQEILRRKEAQQGGESGREK